MHYINIFVHFELWNIPVPHKVPSSISEHLEGHLRKYLEDFAFQALQTSLELQRITSPQVKDKTLE